MQVNAHIARKNVSSAKTPAPYLKARNATELQAYFDNGNKDVLEDGLTEITFGEYLVDQGVLDRFQLFRALQMQDRLPGVRLGECAAALGYAPIAAIERLYERFQQINTVDVP